MDRDPNPEHSPELSPDPVPEPEGTQDPGQMVAFYAELLAVERSVLARMEELAAPAAPELRRMVQKTNIEPLRRLIAEFEARKQRWEELL